MTDTRDPRGIVNFFIRYLVLHAVFLLGFTLSYVTDLFLFYFFGFIGFFTFFQMLIAIPRKFLDEAGSWKPLAIAGALLSDVAVLWWLGGRVSGFLVDSNWELVAIWLPFHFLAAFFAWGLREIFHSPDPQRTTTPSTSVSPTAPVETENLSDSEDTEVDTPTDATAVTEVDTDTDKQ
ncbi:protein CrcB-like protein [Actinomyces sp.]